MTGAGTRRSLDGRDGRASGRTPRRLGLKEDRDGTVVRDLDDPSGPRSGPSRPEGRRPPTTCHNLSQRASACSGAAAPAKLGQFPLRVSSQRPTRPEDGGAMTGNGRPLPPTCARGVRRNARSRGATRARRGRRRASAARPATLSTAATTPASARTNRPNHHTSPSPPYPHHSAKDRRSKARPNDCEHGDPPLPDQEAEDEEQRDHDDQARLSARLLRRRRWSPRAYTAYSSLHPRRATCREGNRSHEQKANLRAAGRAPCRRGMRL